MRAHCSHPAVAVLLEAVEGILDDDVQHTRSAYLNKINQCHAVKAGMDELLGIARSAFGRLTEQIHQLVDKYREDNGLASLKVRGLRGV